MSLNLYDKIAKLVKTHHLQSLTVDVFDTVLLYDYWPESLRSYDLAVRWLPIVRQYIAPGITAYELYSRQAEVSELFRQQKLTARLDLLLDVMIDGLCSKYQVKLDTEANLSLIAELMSATLQFELKNSAPNRQLISQFTQLKHTFPELKMYFVADSALTAEQIKALLELQQVKIFDDGASTADSTAKSKAELFEELPQTFGADFEISKNLHIGDERTADFLAAHAHDSLALHYRLIRMRGLRTLVGAAWIKSLEAYAKLRAQQSQISSESTWQDFGATLAGVYQAWTSQMQDLARLHDDEDVLLAGEEASQLAQMSLVLENNELARTAPEFNKGNVLRAFIWLLAAFQAERWDAARLLALLCVQEQLSRLDLYQLCFDAGYNHSALAVNSFTEEKFYEHFLRELLNADEKYTQTLRTCYQAVASYLPQNQKSVLIIQLSDDNLGQLFQNFAELHGVHNPIRAISLDTNNYVHRQQVELFGLMNPRREQAVTTGLTTPVKTHYELTAKETLAKILYPKLQRLTRRILKNTI